MGGTGTGRGAGTGGLQLWRFRRGRHHGAEDRPPGGGVGVLVFELMKVALQFMNVNSSYTYIVQGLVIIVAVAIDIRKYLAKK